MLPALTRLSIRTHAQECLVDITDRVAQLAADPGLLMVIVNLAVAVGAAGWMWQSRPRRGDPG